MDDIFMSNLLIGIVLLALLGFWWDSLGARQAARKAGRQACERKGMQFLDDTVVISRLSLQRDSRGRLKFYRQYRFEYSLSGEDRLPGQVDLLGKQVLHVEMEWREF
jgi:hypothetical protein